MAATVLGTDEALCEAFEECVVAPGRAILVLNCPKEAFVSIGRNPTASVGVTRQYHLTFDGTSYDCRIKVWLCDKDGQITHAFRTCVRLREHQTVVLQVSRQGMSAVAEKVTRIKRTPDATVPNPVPSGRAPPSNM